jgi:plasmid stabilization system protein ParE
VTCELRWSNAARRDLLDIWRWRGRENAELGDAALNRIGVAYARKLSIDGYLALYRIDDEAVLIVRVVDQRRLLETVRFAEE